MNSLLLEHLGQEFYCIKSNSIYSALGRVAKQDGTAHTSQCEQTISAMHNGISES